MTDLPRWDLTPIFPSLESPEFVAAFDAIPTTVASLTALWERHQINGQGAGGAPVAAFEEVTDAFNTAMRQLRKVTSYLALQLSTDSRDTAVQTRASALRKHEVALNLLQVRYIAWLGTLDIEALVAASPLAADHAHMLRRAQVNAAHLLPPAEEELTAQLALSGRSAWARLYSDLTSQLMVPWGESAEPMSVIRAFAADSDADIRRRAYEAELVTWEKNALPIAAALNAIKHENDVLLERRHWAEPLDAACFSSSIDRPTLDAMLAAAYDSFPDFRRYLRAKAKLLSGRTQLPWYDLFAPVGASTRSWDWATGAAFVREQLATYTPRMGAFVGRALDEYWIDAEPRAGKVGGAYCMGVEPGISRILQNYSPSFDGVSTLAHELGHAYHNLCLTERHPLQAQTPMTLAETASIFCETIVKHAALRDADSAEKLLILEGSIQGSCQVVVDITSRFLFEKRVFERRKERELTIPELNAVMLDAQRETYGDGLDPELLHPYMWAAKGHYYGMSFYNFPYMFGLLFGLGLYARYEAEPVAFRRDYDSLLSRTGMASAAELAAEFGIDLTQKAFWSGSLAILRDEIDQFVALAEE